MFPLVNSVDSSNAHVALEEVVVVVVVVLIAVSGQMFKNDHGDARVFAAVQAYNTVSP